MPKDTTRRRSPSPVANAPRIKRRLPDSLLNRLDRRREAGKPTKWTDRKLNAIVKYVSTLPPPSPSLPAKPIAAVTNEAIAASRRAGLAVQARREREAAEARANTAASSSSRSLAERLSAALTYTPVTPKRIGIDVPKYTTLELLGIHLPKFNAVLKRFTPFDELDYSDIRTEHAAATAHLIRRVREVRELLRPEAIITFQEWKRYDAGLRAIGEVSFKGLRDNLRRVTAELYAIDRAGYFD